MIYRLTFLTAIFIAMLLSAASLTAAGDSNESTNQVIMGNARFTVISAECVRLEYAPTNGFVNKPTLFAINRAVAYTGAKIARQDHLLTIETNKFRLEYRPDGSAFNEKNLTVIFNNGQKAWNPGLKAAQNLGGPVPTLDGWNGPRKLPDGMLSREGWYLLDDSGQPLLNNGWIVQRPGGMAPSAPQGKRCAINGDIDWYLFVYDSDYKAALRALAMVSGKAPMPRRHIFGSWYCRWYHYTADEFRAIVREYKDHDFPLDILVMDMDWHTQRDARYGYGHARNLGWTGYTWNKALIPEPQKLVKELKDEGIFVTLNDHPCDGMRDHEEHYDEFIKMLPGNQPTNPSFNAGDPAYMAAFFKAAHGPAEDDGIDFWWLDWQQDYIYPSVHGVPGLPHLPWLNYLYYKDSEKNNRRGQAYSRWGGWGDHRHPIQFSGDTVATWPMLAFEVPFTAISGNAGCFFWAHDLGGFSGERNPEMFTRWVQFGALSSSLRLHSCGGNLDRRPWLWGEQFENAMRRAYHLRAALMPYIYTSVRQCYDQTLPLIRPMYIEYPSREEAYQNPQQYLFGDSLLSAPISSPGNGPNFDAEQTIWFPEGVWFNLLSNKKFEGSQTVTVKASIDEIPVYAKAGVPIPMQPYTQRMTTAALNTLIVRCYPGESGASSLYEDDGQTLGYTKNEFATTELYYQCKTDCVTLKIGPTKGTYTGQPTKRAYRVELPCTAKAQTATVNGKHLTVSYDDQAHMNVIEIPTQPIGQAVEITIDAPAAK